jgi:anti-sigma B factor antagonist
MGKDAVWLRHKFRALAERDEKQILLNMADITYVDSSGLGELVAAYTRVSKLGGELKLLNLTERVTELMVITKLLTVFESFDDELVAVGSYTVRESAKKSIPVFERNGRVSAAHGARRLKNL